MTDRKDDASLFVEYAATREEALRNRLVDRHAGLAVALARRFDHRGEPLEDLVQVASIGLLKAVERFDPSQGTAFSSFATPTILGEIKRHFRDKTWVLKVPRGLKELHLRVNPAVGELQAELGRVPRIAEVAAHLGVSEDDVLVAMDVGAAYEPASLSSTPPDRSGMPGPDLGEIDPDYERAEARVALRALMEKLPERERAVLYLRYFEDLTQAEIAERVGVSQVHVSRMLRTALAQLGGGRRGAATDTA